MTWNRIVKAGATFTAADPGKNRRFRRLRPLVGTALAISYHASNRGGLVPGNQREADNGDVRREEKARYNKVDDVLGDLTEDRRGDEKVEDEKGHDNRERRT